MLEVGGGGRVKMALGGGMQDKNEVGGGMLYPCVPPCSVSFYHGRAFYYAADGGLQIQDGDCACHFPSFDEMLLLLDEVLNSVSGALECIQYRYLDRKSVV